MTYSKAEISQQVINTLREMFNFPDDKLRPETTLQDELDIDSIDALNLIVELEQKTGKKIDPVSFREMRTVQDVVDALDMLLCETQ